MLSYAAALDVILSAVSPLTGREAPVRPSCSATAAVEVRSRVAVPSFANAAMDGFALRSADTRTATPAAPVRLAIAGSVAAGQVPPAATPHASAWEINTGAPLPADCDAVVAVERVQRSSGPPPSILLQEPVDGGQNRRLAGEDFAPGSLLLNPGSVLGPEAIMALAAAGEDNVNLRTAPRVALITTGSELTASGPPDAQGHIRDVNGPYLEAALALLGLSITARRHVSDDAAALSEAIATLAPGCDLLLTTGGVSAGSLDFVPGTLARLGAATLFHKVAIRPGKPLLLAQLPGGPLVFGLPGNPMAVAVGLRFFVLPAVRALMGRDAERFLPARAVEAIRTRPAMTFFAKAHAQVTAQAVLSVALLPGQESFRISPLLRANCWAVVPAGAPDIAAGGLVEVAPLWPADFPARGRD